jgi:TRAP transporter TAXI family solute receptor
MKKNRLLSLAVIFFLGVVIVALMLGHAQASSKMVRIATTPPGRLFHIIGSGMSLVLKQHTEIAPRVVPIGGPPSWVPLAVEGEVEFGVGELGPMTRAYRGTGEFEKMTKGKGYDVRTVVNGDNVINSIVVRKDSDIKTIPDLRGKRCPTEFHANYVFDVFQRAILANGGLTYDDVKGVPVSEPATARELFKEGRLDVSSAFFPGVATLRETDAAVGGVRFLSLDPSPEAIKKMKEVDPTCTVAPARPVDIGTPGVTADTKFYSSAMGIFTVPSFDEGVVYQFVKAIFEYNSELIKFHGVTSGWTADKFVSEDITVPYHDGAIRYFKERGLWTDKMDRVQKELLSQRPR